MPQNIIKSSILQRIKSVKNLKTDTELSIFLGIKQNTIATWKKRDSIDYDIIIAKCHDVDFNYLFKGSEPIDTQNTDYVEKIRLLTIQIEELKKDNEWKKTVIDSLLKNIEESIPRISHHTTTEKIKK